jgi:hypothetical protein
MSKHVETVRATKVIAGAGLANFMSMLVLKACRKPLR